MEWVKIKDEHISPAMTDAQVGALVRFQLLVARLKRIPTDAELFKVVSKKNWTSIKVVLDLAGVDTDLIASKVLDDSKLVDGNRYKSKIKKQKQREELRLKGDDCDDEISDEVIENDCSVPGDSLYIDKIREDKIREENTTTGSGSPKETTTTTFLKLGLGKTFQFLDRIEEMSQGGLKISDQDVLLFCNYLAEMRLTKDKKKEPNVKDVLRYSRSIYSKIKSENERRAEILLQVDVLREHFLDAQKERERKAKALYEAEAIVLKNSESQIKADAIWDEFEGLPLDERNRFLAEAFNLVTNEYGWSDVSIDSLNPPKMALLTSRAVQIYQAERDVVKS